MKHLVSSQYLLSPWKNGRGVTAQIAIAPDHAIFPEDTFVWRLSTASFDSDGEFSLFPGYQRKLIVWQEGLSLNGKALRPFEVLTFSGSEKKHARLSCSRMSDLGIIYREEDVQVEMQALQHQAQGSQTLTLNQGTHFLFCARGIVKVGEVELGSQEVLMIENSLSNCDLVLKSDAVLIRVTISKK
ncbi:MAG: HutD family protein [Bdellovibrionales bacterium]|nr:HutD family protein [Oligoflexia bacterium]